MNRLRRRASVVIATAALAAGCAGAASVVVPAGFSAPAQVVGAAGTPVQTCRNPIVERDLAEWSVVGTGFTMQRVSTPGHVVARNAAWMNNVPATPRISLPRQTVTPGERQTFAADYWVDRAINPTAQIIVTWFNAAGTSLGDVAGPQVVVPNGPTETWTRVAADFTVPPNAVDARVMPQLNSNTTNASWLVTACDFHRGGTPVPPTTTTPAPPPVTTDPPVTTVPPTTAPPTTTVPPPPPTIAAAGDPQSYWIHWNSTAVSDAVITQEAQRRSVVMLNAWEGDIARKLHAANPAIKVLVYKDLSSTRDYACGDAEIPTGIDYCWANTNHPEWFLTNSSGARFTYSGYAGHYQMDVSNVAYQDEWIRNVVASATRNDFDGVLMDNALYKCDDYHSGSCASGTRHPAMDTTPEFQASYVAMLTNTRNDLAAAGLLSFANLNNARVNGNVWNTYMAQLDGGWDEFWLAFANNNILPEYAEGWSKQMAEIEGNEAAGKYTLVQPHFTNDSAGLQAFRYTFASYLMANGGRASYVSIPATDAYSNPQPWRPEFDYNLGAATGAKTSVASNVWRRNYTCGISVVNANATGSASVTVSLGGSYLNQDGATVTSVSLPGTSGAVLRKAECTP